MLPTASARIYLSTQRPGTGLMNRLSLELRVTG